MKNNTINKKEIENFQKLLKNGGIQMVNLNLYISLIQLGSII